MTITRLVFSFAIGLLAVILGGCASHSQKEPVPPPEPPQLNLALFDQPVHIPDEDEIFELSPAQVEELEGFLARFDDESNRHRDLARFIEDHLAGFDYWGRTLTASQALQTQQGNCMSLAIVTAAFTRHLGLEHDFQLMRTPPVYEREGDLVLVSDHVRTRIYSTVPDQQEEGYGRRSHMIVDYFPERERVPSRGVSKDEFLTMYYINVAAEKLVEDDLVGAFGFAEHASTISPDDASVLNLLAVIHRRGGDEETAEALFRHAIRTHPNDVNLLHNLHALLDSQGRSDEADDLLQRLARLPDQNPYPRLLLARRLAEEGQLNRALSIYQAVAEQLPHMHEAHWGIAIVRHKQGNRVRAHRAMERALELARTPLDERRYRAKLHSLESGSSPDHTEKTQDTHDFSG